MKKRILCLIAAVIICVSAIPFSTSAFSSAVDWVKEGDWYFDIVDGDAIVTAYAGNETNIVVPSSYKGRDVTYFNSDLLTKCPNQDKVTEIYFPSTIYGYFEYESDNYGSGYSKYVGFKIKDYKSLERVEISSANPFYCDIKGRGVYSKDRKILWYVPYNGGYLDFRISANEDVVEIRNISSPKIKQLTIGKNIKKIDFTRINCPNLKSLYITSKTDDVIFDKEINNIPKDTIVYCYKSSAVYKALKKMGHKNIVTEPEKPQTPTIESIKYGRYDAHNYAVKLKISNVGAYEYKVYRYNGKTKKYEYLGKTDWREYIDKTAKPGKTYKYKVTARDKENKLYSDTSSRSKAKSITPKLTKPGKVRVSTFFSSYGTDGRVEFTAEKKVGTGHIIYRYNSSKKKYEKIETFYGLEGFDWDVKTGKTYTYKIRAFKRASTGEKVYGPYSDKIKVKG